MILTPSATSSGAAGFTFWGMVWLAIAKLDALAKLFHVSRWVSSKYVFKWILENKGLTILCTEILNFSIHGITSSIAVTFALGGTVCNMLTVFVILPIVNKIRGPLWLQ